MSAFVPSQYLEELSDAVGKKRYEHKVAQLQATADPFCLLQRGGKEKMGNYSAEMQWLDWPSVTYADIYNYLIQTPSEYTHEMLKSYKSLDGYNFFCNGWISGVKVVKIEHSAKYVVVAQVKHSQTLSATPLKVWVALKLDGEVLSAHCTCMAGIGEVCSHIAAVLFLVEANTRAKQNLSCTSLPCNWLPPSFRTVEFLPVSKIDFRTAQLKRKLALDDNPHSSTVMPSCKVQHVLKPTEAQLSDYYLQLKTMKHKPVILSLVEPYSDAYVPLYIRGVLPSPLTSLFDKKFENEAFDVVKTYCAQLYSTYTITEEQTCAIELHTRSQTKSKLWFQQRAGRVTASKLYSIMRTKLDKPSVSLLKSVCYPESSVFAGKACQYGCQHEDGARKLYEEIMTTDHHSFELRKVGLCVSRVLPFLGASPDGLVQCTCCGHGTLEIKCPYSCRNMKFEEKALDPSFCLDKETLILKKEHPYFYQVQLQMLLTNTKYCDFVLWRQDSILRQRLFFEETFLKPILDHVELFVQKCILPELVCHWFTRDHPCNSSSQPVTTSVPNSLTSTFVSDSLVCHTNGSQLHEEYDSSRAEQTSASLEVTAPVVLTGDSDLNIAPSSVTNDDSTISSEIDEDTWCYCQHSEDYDFMIACEAKGCKIEWYHLSCVNLTMEDVPKDEEPWYCPTCINKTD